MYKYEMGEFKRFGRVLKMSHMIADTPDELHAMADALGLKREYYQGDHYDVSMSLRRKAITLGAVAITLRELAHMARKPRAAKASNKAIQGMLTALKFIEPATREIGTVNQVHCMLAHGYAVGFDGVHMLAHKIDTDITAAPNAKKLLGALSKCDEAVQITQLDSGRLGIKSGKFSAFVPCAEPGLIAILPPDPAQGPINETVIKALQTVGIIAKENAQRMYQASVLLRYNSAVATDGVMAFECWHGTPMPTVVIPKSFLAILAKIAAKPVSCGLSNNSFTIYFEDESIARTQLYVEPYPDVDRVLNIPSQPFPIPPEFFPALDKLAAMKDTNKNLIFNAKGSKLQTHADESAGAVFEFEHPMPDGQTFNIELLQRFAPFVKQADWACGDGGKMAALFGDNFRGVLMCKRPTTEPREYTPPPPMGPGVIEQAVGALPGANVGDLDDEIPF